jgi:hypothetical protein
MAPRKGGDIIAEFLVKEKIPYVFGICGHGNVGLLDSLYDRRDKKITRTLTRALKLVTAAKNKPPRAAMRRLKRADTMLKSAVARIATSDKIPEAQAQTLVAAITDLVNQIRAVVAELLAQLGGGAK